mgnify:CR=1 FL=1|tara:strand:- start:123 stop:977 length:855 start_codon:yes stop_codon:yes gene_type:complete
MKKIFIALLCCFVLVGCKKKGCTDPLAVNYDSSANNEDGTCLNVPTLSTIPLVSSSNNSVQTGGIITSDGNSLVTERGVCWGTSPNPNIFINDKTIDGSGTGTYTSYIGVGNLTTYYVRAYATNSNGTGYGNEISSPLMIGSYHQEGIVFYLDGNGGGLIAAPIGQLGVEWGCLGTVTGADGVALGTGNQNTIDIEAGCTTSGTAADICANLTLGGYSDWFLPSKDELNLMYENIDIINNDYYWSSSESASGMNGFAWAQDFSNGSQTNRIKDATAYVRAVRAF